jgi:hypothetical protein
MKIRLFLLLVFIASVSCSSPRTKPYTTSSVHQKYLRSDWNHWTDRDRNCIDTRGEILTSRSLSTVVMDKRGCRVKSGKWKDYYYPEDHTLAAKVDIDHLVPLKYAHDNGAAGWSEAHKEVFANDPENLVITNRSYNRQKGAKGIDQWLPRHKEYACKYIRDWMKIKKKYKLIIKDQERTAVQDC